MHKKNLFSRVVALVLLLALCLPVTVHAQEYTVTVGTEVTYSFGRAYNTTSTFSLDGAVPGMVLTQQDGIMVLQGKPTTPGEYFVMFQETTADGAEFTSSFTVIVRAAETEDDGKNDTPTEDPTEDPNGPKVTKHPTGEQVVEGESAIFIARAEGAQQYEWELLTADKKNIYCADLKNHFPQIKVTGWDTEKLSLSNIPVELDGCKVRCRFVGTEGSSCSDYALITVIAEDAKPEVTKQPTGERVKEGNMCQFVARADNAIEYTWMALTEDGHSRYECSVLTDLFPDMRVEGADSECLTLYSIPAELDGWSFYCVFTGPGGDVSSDTARLSVTPLPTEPTETEEPTTEPTTEATEPPTTEAPTTEATESPTEPPATEVLAPAETEPAPQKSGSKLFKRGFFLVIAAVGGLAILAIAAFATYLILRIRQRADEDEYDDDEDEYDD